MDDIINLEDEDRSRQDKEYPAYPHSPDIEHSQREEPDGQIQEDRPYLIPIPLVLTSLDEDTDSLRMILVK